MWRLLVIVVLGLLGGATLPNYCLLLWVWRLPINTTSLHRRAVTGTIVDIVQPDVSSRISAKAQTAQVQASYLAVYMSNLGAPVIEHEYLMFLSRK